VISECRHHLQSNDVPGELSAGFVRWRKHCQVSAIVCELMRGDLAIADGGQFVTQQLNRRTMLRCRTLEVDNTDPRALLQGGRKIVEEGVGLAYLVIHVHEDGGIQRGRGQAGVVRFAQRESDVCQSEQFRSLSEFDKVIPRDVLGDDGAGGAEEARETDRVVATACTDVADRHAWL
jgi:hypothetical protein